MRLGLASPPVARGGDVGWLGTWRHGKEQSEGRDVRCLSTWDNGVAALVTQCFADTMKLDCQKWVRCKVDVQVVTGTVLEHRLSDWWDAERRDG